MSITLLQINDALAARGKDAVEASQLHEALDYALGVYAIPYPILNANEPDERLIVGIALLAEQAPFAAVQTAALKSQEIAGDSGSIKKTWADAPADPYPVITGLLAPYSGRTASIGISFGVSTR